MKFEINMNRLDQFVRLGVGIACIYAGFIDHTLIDEPVISICVGIFGVINLFSVATRHCPVYHVAGINTNAESNTQ